MLYLVDRAACVVRLQTLSTRSRSLESASGFIRLLQNLLIAGGSQIKSGIRKVVWSRVVVSLVVSISSNLNMIHGIAYVAVVGVAK